MQAVPVQNSIGMVLCHDITRIVPGESKGPAFKKGHIVTEKDIPTLLDIGKEHLYVLNLTENQIHENEAAIRIANAVAGEGITLSDVSEGRVNLIANKGLLSIDVEKVHQINAIDEVVLSTMHNGLHVLSERPIAGTRIVPLVTDRSKVEEVEAVCATGGPVIQVKPFKHHKVGVVTTGSEVYNGRITDKFGPVIRKKFHELGSNVVEQVFVPDDQQMTTDAINAFLDDGIDFVVVTGGMSVDPDDRTPASIRDTGADVVTYGSPTFPGAMFMLAYKDNRPIIGLPGCVMYYRASIFDLIVPRILAGETITRKDITNLGHGGFCAGCETCHFPLCSFGKSS